MTKKEIIKDLLKFQESLKSPDFVWFIGMIDPPRPGVRLCFTKLEYMFYPPDTPRNESFMMGILGWDGILWGVVGIPVKEKEYMDEIASGIDLEIIPKIPCSISSAGIDFFPIKGKNVYMLINAETHPIFGCATKEEISDLFKEESEEIKRVIEKKQLH